MVFLGNLIKMKKVFITNGLIGFLILSSCNLFAQQDPLFTHYMFSLSTVNPASVGHVDNASVMNIDRFQWVGLDGAPRTYTLNLDIPIKTISCGAGLTYVLDKIGPEKTNNIYVDYAYHLDVNENLKLGLGLKAGFRVFSASLYDDFGISNPDDPQFSSNINGKITPNFGVGAFLYNNTFYVGLSAPKVLNHKYVNSTTSGGEKRHYFLVSGYVYPINRNILFKPSVYLRCVEGAPVSFDVNANILVNKIVWFGLMYRKGDAVGFLTQVRLNDKINIGYTYDLTFSKIRTAAKGTHELMLSFEFQTEPPEDRDQWHF